MSTAQVVERQSGARRAALLAVILLELLTAILVAPSVVAFRDYPFDSDEAVHANNGLVLMLDLRAGDVGAFVSDVYRQAYYPPAFSWIKALVFAIFGASTLVARMFSLACLLLAGPVIYALCLELDETQGRLAGLIALALTLSAQTILENSGLANMETPGVLVSFALLWVYLRALRQPTPGRLALTSLLLIATFCTKYTYGLVVVATLAVMEGLAALSSRTWGAVARRWLWLFGPFALAMVVWFAQPYKIDGLREYVASAPQGQDWFSAESLLFYPRSIALHYAPSPIFALLTLASVLWAITRWRDVRLRLLLIYFAIGLLEMTLNPQKTSRFIATYVPAVHVLTGAMLARFVAAWREGWSRRRAATVAATAAVAVCVVASVPVVVERIAAVPALLQVSYETSPQANQLAGWLTAQVPLEKRLYLINPWDQFSALMLEWYRGAQAAPADFLREAMAVPWTYLEKASPEKVQELWQAIRDSGAQYVVALEGSPEGEPVWHEYAAALGEALVPVAVQDFEIEQYAVGRWLRQSLLTRDGLARATADRRYTLHIRATLYQLVEP